MVTAKLRETWEKLKQLKVQKDAEIALLDAEMARDRAAIAQEYATIELLMAGDNIAKHPTTPMRTTILPPKKRDFSQWFETARLTDRQREVASLRFEHEMSVVQIAFRLDRHRKTIQECLDSVDMKLRRAHSIERTRKEQAKRLHI